MKIDKASSLYKELVNQKGNLCVTIIFPVVSDPFDTKADKIHIKSVQEKVEAMIKLKGDSDFIIQFIKKIKDAFERINFSGDVHGIGIYISNNFTYTIPFPFTVKEKIMIDYSFETRHVLLNDYFNEHRLLLMLSENFGKLFQCKGYTITEIHDEKFPAVYEELYEYEKPSRGTSFQGSGGLKQFEKDKSISLEMRQQDFYKSIDKNMKEYILDNTPLILMGTSKDISYYEKHTHYSKKILGKIEGNYEHSSISEIAERVSEVIRAGNDKDTNSLLMEVRELVGKGMTTTGIKEIWRDVKAGKGLKLLVEEDFYQTAFTSNGDDNILTQRMSEKNKVIRDAVDEIIEMVLEKNGDVVFLKNGQLHSYNRMILIRRY